MPGGLLCGNYFPGQRDNSLLRRVWKKRQTCFGWGTGFPGGNVKDRDHHPTGGGQRLVLCGHRRGKSVRLGHRHSAFEMPAGCASVWQTDRCPAAGHLVSVDRYRPSCQVGSHQSCGTLSLSTYFSIFLDLNLVLLLSVFSYSKDNSNSTKTHWQVLSTKFIMDTIMNPACQKLPV